MDGSFTTKRSTRENEGYMVYYSLMLHPKVRNLGNKNRNGSMSLQDISVGAVFRLINKYHIKIRSSQDDWEETANRDSGV